MIHTCKVCGKYKEKKEFPWLKIMVCRDCHMYRAMNWAKIPWPKGTSDKKRKSGLAGATKRWAKRGLRVATLNDSAKNGLEHV